MPWSIADTVYDARQHPWDSISNGPPGNPLKQTPYELKLMAQAVQTADPATPEALIRQYMTAGPPADVGPAPPPPTIETVLDGSALQPRHLYDRAPTDFSGTPAGIEASSRNNISVG